LPEGVPVSQQDEWTQKHHRQLGEYMAQCWRMQNLWNSLAAGTGMKLYRLRSKIEISILYYYEVLPFLLIKFHNEFEKTG